MDEITVFPRCIQDLPAVSSRTSLEKSIFRLTVAINNYSVQGKPAPDPAQVSRDDIIL